MELSRRVALEGVQLDEAHERIAIQGVSTPAPKASTGAAARAGGGSRRTGGNRDSLEITVSFTIIIKKARMTERDAALDAANAWAAIAADGAWMTYSGKPGKRIRVYLDEPASLGDAREAGKTFTVKFRAYGVPYWEDETAASVTLADGSYATGSLSVGGNARTVAGAYILNISGAVMQTLIVQCGSSAFRLTGLAAGAGSAVIIDHNPEGLLIIRVLEAGGTVRSVLGRREADSSDDLYVSPGMAAVSVSADRAVRATFTARGRWL